MADNQTEKQKVQELTDKLERGLTELFNSDSYKNYLSTMSRFHDYSFNNTLLIAMQKPEASLVAGYKAWQKNFDRHVNKGEKAIRILAPAPYKIKEERDKIDPVTQEIMLDRDGNPQKEEVEITIPAFRAVSVFDVSQTDGKPIPELEAKELLSDVEGYQDMIHAVEAVSPVPIEMEEIAGESKGYFNREAGRIAVQENMSESQTLKTMIHEVAHSKLHNREVEQEEQARKDRNTKEVEAESIAYTVCQHFGVDTSEYSFGYIAGWSSGRDTKELKSSMDTIRRTASELITGIEEQLEEIRKDREVLQEKKKDSILLIQNNDLSEYSLLDVYGMDRQELMQILSEMVEDDKQSIPAYLESKGAWVTEIANQDTREHGEYHLDVCYNTDTGYLFDMKEQKAIYDKAMEPINVKDVIVKFASAFESEWEILKITNLSRESVGNLLKDMAMLDEKARDGDYHAYLTGHGAEMTLLASSKGLNTNILDLWDFKYDFDAGLTDAVELSAMQQAEHIIHRLEHGQPDFSDDERNLIVNYAFKLGDMEKTRKLAECICAQKLEDSKDVVLTMMDAQKEIDALQDSEAEIDKSQGKHEDSEARKAAQLLHGSMDKYGIYQLKDNPELDKFRFEGTESLKRMGITKYNLDSIVPENYEQVYMGELTEFRGRTKEETLEAIYTKFNIDHPADYKAHSLSVSDIVVLHENRENSAHFVDTFGFTGLPQFMRGLEEKAEDLTVTFTVAECGEFHEIGAYYEDIPTIEEAIRIYREMDPARLNGVPAIGVNLHVEGTDCLEDDQVDLLTGNIIDVDYLNYMPDVRDHPSVQDAIKKLIEEFPEKEVNDWKTKEQKIQALAGELDRLSYDMDPYEYNDTVSDQEAQIQRIAEDIQNGNIGHLQDFLQTSIEEGTDEDWEKRVKELLVKLAEYKPLAKVEEMEEQNYNMIDNVLNNGMEKFNREKDNQTPQQGRISLKERLCVKQCEVSEKQGRDSQDQKKVKKNSREM